MVAVGLELSRRRDGRWPATLEEVTPEFLSAVPTDRF
jgi:hypothetical protein